MNKNIKWKDVPVSNMINTQTDPVGDLLDGTMRRLDAVSKEKVEAFMIGNIEKMPDQVFYTDLRTALNALHSLRRHF